MKPDTPTLDRVRIPADLKALSDRDLKKVPGIGERSLDEIKQQLAKFGLALRD